MSWNGKSARTFGWHVFRTTDVLAVISLLRKFLILLQSKHCWSLIQLRNNARRVDRCAQGHSVGRVSEEVYSSSSGPGLIFLPHICPYPRMGAGELRRVREAKAFGQEERSFCGYLRQPLAAARLCPAESEPPGPNHVGTREESHPNRGRDPEWAPVPWCPGPHVSTEGTGGGQGGDSICPPTSQPWHSDRSSSELSALPLSWYGSAGELGRFGHLCISLRILSLLGCGGTGNKVPWTFSEFCCLGISVLPFSSFWLGILLNLFKPQVSW